MRCSRESSRATSAIITTKRGSWPWLDMDASLVQPGEFNRWDTIYERFPKRFTARELHVACWWSGRLEKQAFEAWTLLKRGCIGEDDQKALEDKAREILRRAYRHAWNLPHVRETLASDVALYVVWRG